MSKYHPIFAIRFTNANSVHKRRIPKYLFLNRPICIKLLEPFMPLEPALFFWVPHFFPLLSFGLFPHRLRCFCFVFFSFFFFKFSPYFLNSFLLIKSFQPFGLAFLLFFLLPLF